MDFISASIKFWKFNRSRTLALLDDIAKEDDPEAVLKWQAGPGRAHIGWQIMHIAITEQLFATERLLGKDVPDLDLANRFRGGSTPDDNVPTLAEIRDYLKNSRSELLEVAANLSNDDLDKVPESFKERGWTLETILEIVAWHEGHHQGQAHATYNLWKNQ